MAIFSDQFVSVEPAIVVDSIKEKGYFSFEKAVNSEFLQELTTELSQYRPSININSPAPVWLNDQYFFPQAFAACRSYYDYIVSEKILSICRAAFDDSYRLKCHRYYETSYGHSMEWHADNVTNNQEVTETDGFIFILYVNDVFDGEFQLVTNSYEERKSGEWSYAYSNRYIEDNYADRIQSFAMPAGSIVIYDTYGIHRAKPITAKGFTRKSIFFQVDSSNRNAEEIIVNPAFITTFNDEIARYLGFGQVQDFKSNPQSNVKHIPIPVLLRFGLDVLKAVSVRSIKYVFRKILSHDQKMKIARKWDVHL